MAAPDTAGAQDAQAATITAAPSPDIGSAQPLPPMTIYSRQRKHARAIKRKPVPIAQAPRATPAPAATRPLPDGIVLDGGPAVTQTTAGPVSGYRALTSTSATKTDTPIEREALLASRSDKTKGNEEKLRNLLDSKVKAIKQTRAKKDDPPQEMACIVVPISEQHVFGNTRCSDIAAVKDEGEVDIDLGAVRLLNSVEQAGVEVQVEQARRLVA